MKVYNKIRMKKIEEIVPYFNNPRKNEKTTQALIKIIPMAGFNVPILIDTKNVIIKGHSRFHAAKELGMKKVPCIISENSDKQNNADRVYDNAVQELSDWNLDKLSEELRGLDDALLIPEIPLDFDKLTKYNAEPGEMDELYDDAVTPEDLAKAEKGVLKEVDGKKKGLLALVCSHCGGEVLVSPEDVVRLAKQKGLMK